MGRKHIDNPIVGRNGEIVALLKAGTLTLEVIGQRFGLTRQRIHKIGIAAGYARGRREFPAETLAHAARLIDRGMPVAHAAKIVGVNSETLAGALARRGLYTRVNNATPWSADEKRFVLKHYNKAGWPASRIADRLGRSRNEVIGKAHYMMRSGKPGRAAA